MTEFQFGFIYDGYKAEVDVMHKIDAQAPFYGLVISAFGGVVGYLLTHSGEVSNGDLRMLVVSITILSTVALALAIYHLVKSYVGQRYRFTPDATALDRYFRQLVLAYSGNGSRADVEARTDLASQLAQIADFNREANRKRYARYNNCAYFLMICLICWVFAGATFALTKDAARATPSVSTTNPN